MKKCFTWLCFGFLVGGCFPTGQDLYNVSPRFSTSESSVLFFRNTRMVFYDFQEKPEASIEIYRPKEATASPDVPGYVWFMAYNRLQDTARVFHESTPPLDKDPCVGVDWEWDKQDGTRQTVASMPCPGLYPEDNFQFLVRSYRQADAGRVASMRLASGKTVPLFATEENQRRFMRLVRDYLELVNLI